MSARENVKANQWLESLHREPSTLREHERHLDKLFEFLLQEVGKRAEDVDFRRIVPFTYKGQVKFFGPINHVAVNAFLRWLVRGIDDEDKRGRKRNRAIHTLRLFFQSLCDDEFLLRNPMHHVRPARVAPSTPTRKFLTVRESAALLHAAMDSGEHAKRNATLVLCLLRSGARPGELCSLRFDGLEFVSACMRVTGKTGPRTVPMPPALATPLRRYLDSRYVRERRAAGVPWLFCNDQGDGPLDTDTLRDMIREWCGRAGIDTEITTYWLRHTFATDAYRMGVSIVHISEGLGHVRLKNTNIYVHMRLDRFRRILERGPAIDPLVNLHRDLLKLVP